MVGRESPCSLL